MAKINILPSNVYNFIAAGEVVDRPYSVVKELVENAIDAKATQIEIFIEDGGKQLIRVIDNGTGIEREDLHSAFMPHATSKIATVEDMANITTLGFRGEAIASIASVSNMTITSQVEGSKCYSLNCNGGAMGKITEVSGEKGTDVRVETLFRNTPVRLGFLKADKAEEADITNYVSRFMLNRSDIAFTYYVNGKKVLQSFGGGEDEALVSVYGASVLSQCYKIDAERHGIRVHGYIGNQNFYKSNKSYQSIFLNGRYIINGTISTAVSNAYASYLMKRQYPFYVLYITVPREIVDVNVHPNKSDVRFSDNRIIFGTVHNIISAVLDGNSKALDYVVKDNNQTEIPPAPAHIPALTSTAASVADVALLEKKNSTAANLVREYQEYNKQTSQPPASAAIPPVHTTTLSEQILKQAESEKNEKKEHAFTYEDAQKELQAFRESLRKNEKPTNVPKGVVLSEDIPEVNPDNVMYMTVGDMERNRPQRKNPERLSKITGSRYRLELLQFDDSAYEQAKKDGTVEDFFEENKRFLLEQEEKSKQNRIEVQSCVYCGKLFNTYLLYEYNQEVYIIDQHAAHERLIFDRLKEQMFRRKVIKQPMLMPFEMEVNAFEASFLREHLGEIREMGFDITESWDRKFRVTAVPVDLQNINLKVFFNDILGEINGYKAIKLADILKDKLASAACKAAVKGGMDLTLEEVNGLLKQMDGNMGLKCPHGRPVVVKMTRTQIEKMFKRIV